MEPSVEASSTSVEYIIEDEPEYLARMVSHRMDGGWLNIMHLDFRIWSPRAFKKLLRHWKAFRQKEPEPLFVIHNGEDDDKWRRFVERLGFTYFMNVDCPDGINRRCYVSN